MADLQVTMPEPMKEWVEAQIRSGRYANASDYLRDLVRRDQDANQELIEALEEGAASGISDRSLEDIWQAARSKARG
jgi:antitoxin ParD1/3/4